MRRRTRNSCRRGVTMVYAVVAIIAMIGVISLAVDWGRVQSAKSELEAAGDAAARAGCTGLNDATYVSSATLAAASNTVDGVSLTLLPTDVSCGLWNTATRQFTVTGTSPNAVRVMAVRTSARLNPVPLVFATVIGRPSVDMSLARVAYVAPYMTTKVVPGSACPYLAGMPAGSSSGNGDTTSNASPAQISGIPVTPGKTLTVETVGGVSNTAATGGWNADGQAGNTSVVNTTMNGISNITAPLSCMMGVFLDDNAPNTTAAPSARDFSTAASRNFLTLSPALKQVFFVGDGLTSSGVRQGFVVPAGATRLYLCTLDSYEWANNAGSITATVTAGTRVVLAN